ncbi:MAG TPA: PEP-CTERM sorting domain-containing protein [Vicinamibacterales bacterium]|jgi:hypothetical protein|nr:PEP-CTERM sorting domain-containing protein [Vicinamibacterales bacterium]
MSIRKLLTSAMLVGVTFSASSVPVQADPVTIESTGVVFWPGFRAGDVLRVSFDMRGYDPPPPMDTLDVLAFTTFMIPIEPIDSYTVRVIDRGTVLGSYTAPFDPTRAPSSSFKASTSPFALGVPTIIDFSSFNDGTFDGAVEFTIHSGMGNGGRLSEGLVLGRTVDPSTFINTAFVYPDQHSHWEVIPAASPVPEPTSLVLLGTGVAGLLARRFHRRAKQRPASAG